MMHPLMWALAVVVASAAAVFVAVVAATVVLLLRLRSTIPQTFPTDVDDADFDVTEEGLNHHG